MELNQFLDKLVKAHRLLEKKQLLEILEDNGKFKDKYNKRWSESFFKFFSQKRLAKFLQDKDTDIVHNALQIFVNLKDENVVKVEKNILEEIEKCYRKYSRKAKKLREAEDQKAKDKKEELKKYPHSFTGEIDLDTERAKTEGEEKLSSFDRIIKMASKFIEECGCLSSLL